MTLLEKEILFIVSRLRCLTENQLNKLFNFKRDSRKKTLKRTLRRMCSDCILIKFPCNINYKGFRDNSYVYYISGSEFYRGDDLIKALLSSEIVVKLKLFGFPIERVYKNISIGENKYLYVEYINTYSYKRKQALFDIQLKREVDFSKYTNLKREISDSTIPFFMLPNVIVVSKLNENTLQNTYRDKNIITVDFSLASLFKYL